MAVDMINGKERMVVTKVFDAPVALVWKAWTDPKYVMQWWGPKGFTSPVCKIDFRVGGKYLFCMKSPDGSWEGWNGGEYHEIVPQQKIVYSMYFADAQGNKVNPEDVGVDHGADADVRDVVTFEDLGNGKTKLTLLGNETMAEAKESGQYEGWNEIFDKITAVVAAL